MNTDPIADFLTRIRNATKTRKNSVKMPHSAMKESVAKILEKEGIIEKSRVDQSEKFPILIVTLQSERSSLDLKRISKPGRRVYQKSSDIYPVRNGFGISILTTSQGLMTGEEAKKEGIGGEVLCEIY